MTRLEFGVVMNYIRVGIGKELSVDALEVYFDCLGDLDAAVLQTAAKRVLAEHRWATFPSIAELREAAVSVIRSEVRELSGAEAWELCWRAVAKIDLDIDGSVERATKHLPPLVREAMHGFSLPDLCHGSEPVGVLRAQFIKHFDALAARDRRAALLPPGTVGIADKSKPAIAAPVRAALNGIGKAVGDDPL